MTLFVSLSKSMRVKTTVGTPRCGVRSAQRADPTIRAHQAICVIPAPKITPNVLGNLNMTAPLMRRGLIEIVDEIRHFYQFTVATQSSYPLSQSRSNRPNPNNQWNF
jgi:hypothetical protein